MKPTQRDAGPSLTRDLAGLIVEADDAWLSAEVVAAFKRSLLDVTGCIIGASALPATAGVKAHFEELGGRSEAEVIGQGLSLPACHAAFVNGAMAHGLDFDEGHTAAGSHPGAVVMPAALAAGEKAGAPFREIMLAAVLGYEVMLRLALAIHPRSANAGWHNTGVAGVFGATAAAGRLLGLDRAQLRSAFGIALSFAGGTLQFQDNGADTKRLHAGKAAHDGVLAASLAKRGLKGPDQAVEGGFGLAKLYGGTTIDRSAFLARFGQDPLITQTYFKPFAGNRHLHACLDALLHLRNQHGLTPDRIAAVALHTYTAGVKGHTHLEPGNLLDAQSSLPFMAAVILSEGRATPAVIGAAIGQPEIARLAGLVTASIDPACDALYPRERAARVRITLADGRHLDKSLAGPRGERDNPLSQADLERKFAENCREALPAAMAAELSARIATCEQLADAKALLAGIRTEPAAYGVAAQ